MKIKQFRSILAIAVVAASVTASVSPAQAFTWDDLWNAVKRGYENAPSSNSPQQSNGGGNETPQSGGFNNETPQPQTAPANPVPQQSNFNPSQSSTVPQPTSPQQPIVQRLRARCVKVNGLDFEAIGRDSSESMISVGRRAVRVSSKFYISDNNPHERTCTILSRPASEKVGLVFAIPDNSSIENVRVSIFVGGREKISRIMSRGQLQNFTFDISGANSYATVIQPLNSSAGYMNFIPSRQPE
jgi:hypothetical protein